MILLQNVSNQYKGMEISKDNGVYLWIKNAIRLTSNKATPILAIDNVSFAAPKGEILGIYGSNGAGKTTLIKLLSGLLYPTSGTITIDGRTDNKHIKNTVSYISTNGWMGLEWQLTARENLLLYGNMFGMSGKSLELACDEVLRTIGMSEASSKYISQLSAGMRQKITVARGLILGRPIIFYDEPSVRLDVGSARTLRELIRTDASENKRTAIIASHNQEDLSVCDKILMLSRGKIIAAGTLDELMTPLAGTQIIELKIPRQEREVRFETIDGIESITCGDVDGKRDYQSIKIRARRADFDLNALMWVLDTLFTTIIFFMLSLVTRGSDISFFPYGSNYVSFVVLGLFVHFISYTNLGDPFPRVSRIYWGGTMDLYMLSPLSYFTPMLGIMFRGVIDDYPRSILALLFGWLFFGAVFTFHNPLALLLILILTLISTFGIGMISASSFYLFDFKQQVEPVKFIFQDVIIALTAGYYYPITVLPYPLQILGGFIPHTYALDALRRLMIPGGDALTPVLPLQIALSNANPITLDILVLAIMTAVFLPLVWFMYVKGIERARRDGTLTRWQ